MKTNLRRLRKAAGLTQAEVAEKLNYSSSVTVTQWERGYRKPPSDKLPELACVLGCTIDDLFRDETNAAQTN